MWEAGSPQWVAILLEIWGGRWDKSEDRVWHGMWCRVDGLVRRLWSSLRGVLQADKIMTLTKAAGVTVEPYWPALFARLFETKSIGDLICNVGSGERGGAWCRARAVDAWI